MIERFIKFAGVGGIATLIQYAILMLFIEWFLMNETAAAAASFIISAFINYYLNYHYTFKSIKPHRSVLPKFLVIAHIGLVTNVLIFSFFNQMGYHYLVSQAIATLTVLFINFTANAMWSFK